ncbi:MAG: AAA family ATPase [Phormidesmis sp. RL_2_1]|nr:AAA family ATPase [Phormidesmis sp. RL_2_1]
MAQMIPETIPSHASQGEKLLFQVLQERLPDNFLVWYEPTIRRLLPDFIILGPAFGLLILEVKGWYAGNVELASHDFFQVRREREGKTKIESYANPLKQGHGYFATVADKMVGFPLLCRPEGKYQGTLAFPIGVGAIMSNITAAQSREHALYPVLEQPAVAYRDELLDWPDCSSRELIARLKGMFKTDFAFPPLTNDQISTIRGLLHPITIVREVPAIASSLPPEAAEPLPAHATRLLSLDLEQERLARTMKAGHRVISGVAGSGKTLILIARAKALANSLKQRRVLILCFNITLASHLRSLLHSDSRNPQYKEAIEVLHFHGWAKTFWKRLPSPKSFKTEEAYNQHLGEKVLAYLHSLREEKKWDAVLVDEAHTFDKSWFPCCVAALKDTEEGDLMIVSDRNQGLYKRSEFSWKSVGVKAQGRSKKLAQNYRNTQEILSAAWDVLKPSKEKADSAFLAVEPSAALRHGPMPVFHSARSKWGAIEQTLAQVQVLCEAGYSLSDIAIVYKYKSHQEADGFQLLLEQMEEKGMKPYWITADAEAKRTYDSQRPGVRIVTALSSLGLEFKAVLLLWVEQFWGCHDRDLAKAESDRRQLYVAMTRAQDELHLFAGGQDKIVKELRDSENFLLL